MKLSLPLSFLLYLPALGTAEERSPDAPLLRALQDQAVHAEAEAEAGQRQLSKYGDASKRDGGRDLEWWGSSYTLASQASRAAPAPALARASQAKLAAATANFGGVLEEEDNSCMNVTT
mmetsp:Transcript_3595/g.5517  ORF Transcript_3595/g.5517 Transcript_3595/m.5517 type:complete len:119 (+) Transcript_3595:256-612(+)